MDAKGGYGYRGDNSCFVAILDMEILVPVMKPIVFASFPTVRGSKRVGCRLQQ